MQKKLGDGIAHIHTGLPDLEPRKSSFTLRSKEGAPLYDKELEMLKNGLFITIAGYSRSSKSIRNYMKKLKNRKTKK